MLPKMLLNAFHQPRQLPWKLVLLVAGCLIILHLAFFPETRQSIIEFGKNGVITRPLALSDVDVTPTLTPAPTPAPQPETPPESSIVDETEQNDHIEAVSSPVVLPIIQSATVPTPETPSPDPSIIDEPEEEYVALCMAIKDQGRDLGEFFVHHYHHVGIKRFYIMDDGSNPPMSEFEYPGVPRSALTFVYFDPANRTKHLEQGLNYRRCLKEYGSLHTWMGFIDGDEFIEMVSNDTLDGMLRAFIENDDTIGQLAINWRMHTSSGLLTRPESARKSFVQCISDETDGEGRVSDNHHVKPIVRTAVASHPKGAHLWNLNEGSITVGEHGDVVDSLAWRDPITRDRISLHHYAVKSREEYEEKMHRGNGEDVPKGEIFWDAIEKEYPHVACPEMAKYNP